MLIVIIDSGVAERFQTHPQIVFPPNVNCVPPILSGHGTAIFGIISKKCSKFAEIINFRIINIESGVASDLLVDALSYISDNLHPDIINLSLGITECTNLQALYNICLELTKKGSIIVSAFDNGGAITYPAAFENVIGVVSGASCKKTDDFEFFEDNIVNIGAKGSTQQLLWNDPNYVFLSGNSFACAHATTKIAEMIQLAGEPLSIQEILNNFGRMAIKTHSRLEEFSFPKVPFTIERAVIFPFAKEMHSLIRYTDLLHFKIVDIYDIKYSAKVGSNTQHLMKDSSLPYFVIKNIDNIDYSTFDTIIIGHTNELIRALNGCKIIDKIITNSLSFGKKIFSFDDLSNYGSFDDLSNYGSFDSNKVYFPVVKSHNAPHCRLGMLHNIATPVVGVCGTSAKQGKYTLQLELIKCLTTDGYSVGTIGTEPTAQLFGMDYVFPMGYNSTVYIEYNDVISYLNTAMFNMSGKKDIIIVGSQSGTIPYSYGNLSYYPTFQHLFLMGTLPDCIVLCVNLFDSFEYIHRTISFLESLINSKVIALATIPFSSKNSYYRMYERSEKLLPNKDFIHLKKLYESEFHVPLINITEKDEIHVLSQAIIDYFS